MLKTTGTKEANAKKPFTFQMEKKEKLIAKE
jgi:hypothetical protein